MALTLFLIFSLFLHGALGEFICEELPIGKCSYSIESSGKRCLLETSVTINGNTKLQCKTSEVVVKNMGEFIEGEACVRACGVDRKSVGISSDSLLEPQFTAKLCSPTCYENCPNIIDLYYNLAVAEGVFLPDLCKASRNMPRRAMVQLSSSGVAAGPISGGAAAPMSDADSPMSSESSIACAPTFV